VLLREVAEHREGVGAGLGVRVADDDERRRGLGDPPVGVGGEPGGAVVLQDVHARQVQCGQVRDDDELVRLRHERGQTGAELRNRLMEDDDRRDAHSSSR
jgi:hypothetical protein